MEMTVIKLNIDFGLISLYNWRYDFFSPVFACLYNLFSSFLMLLFLQTGQ